MTEKHIGPMRAALQLASEALERNEFPVGCVLTHRDRIIARGSRTGTRLSPPDELDHAEMIALRQLERLNPPGDRSEMTIYTTLEPCLMCFGAILLSGIGTIVYGYEDIMGGGTGCELRRLPELYRTHPIKIVGGTCREESLGLFKSFFSNPAIDYWRESLLATYTLAQP